MANNTPLSDMTLQRIMRGFSLRDGAAEQMPEIPDAFVEAALSHVVPDKVARAYKRTDFLEMRRKLLDAWATYLRLRGNVVNDGPGAHNE